MARNVEIKGWISNWDEVEARAAALSVEDAIQIEQDDTFYCCETGRLKLRRFADGSGELIYYERDDTEGPKGSFYLVTPQSDPDSLDASLTKALGIRGRVRKQRTLYRVGRTRIHLDRVEGLGMFMELEVVLAEADDLDSGIAEAEEIRIALEVSSDDLVSGAYIDLIERQAV